MEGLPPQHPISPSPHHQVLLYRASFLLSCSSFFAQVVSLFFGNLIFGNLPFRRG